ncbi:MAG: GntR family transcriptional regulator [Gemmatimonadaceae bacterium]|nr:GntR family transcriptional regulator [Gemmatimonadaceae bacterium]
MPSAARKLERPCSVYQRLRDLIIRGRLAPGVRVVEQDVAERLGVSRTPAREAIHRLFQDGFLIPTGIARRTELVVAPLTHDDMWDLYLVMASLEGRAALAIGDLDGAARRDLARTLKATQARFEKASRERKVDYDQMFELHNQFHDTFVRACRRPRIVALIDGVRQQVDRYEWVYAPLVGPDHGETFREHADIIAVVRSGSAKGVQRAVEANWEGGARRLARVIGSMGARGDW